MGRRPDYIFCINTGRSGSHYLSRLMKHVSGCVAFHEPEPICNGSAMRQHLSGRPDRMRRLTETKVSVIESLRRGPDRTYVETNHCFVKGFGWYLPEHLGQERMGVIVLTREKEAVARSLLRIGCTPLVPGGRDWLITPDVSRWSAPPPGPASSPRLAYALLRFLKLPFRGARYYAALRLRAPRTPRLIHDYELACLRWYVDETMALASAYRRAFPRVSYLDVGLDELNTLAGVRRVLDHFGLEEESSIREVVGRATNARR